MTREYLVRPFLHHFRWPEIYLFHRAGIYQCFRCVNAERREGLPVSRRQRRL